MKPRLMDQTHAQQAVTQWNARFHHHAAIDIVRFALDQEQLGQIAMVSSFGAESVALLHMIALVDKKTPVLFIDTHMHFPETLAYQMELRERLGLCNLHHVMADRKDLVRQDPSKTLHKSNPDQCCDLRKTRPLNKALAPYQGWITGRKRFQSSQRKSLAFFEYDGGTQKIKINPLAHWAPKDVIDYIEENRLPKHPLVAQGYPSIGCAPCTTRADAGEDPRSGRWRQAPEKTECGIHFSDGALQRLGEFQ